MYEEAGNSNLLMLLNTAIYPFLAAMIVSFILGKLNKQLGFIGLAAGFLVGLGLIHSGLNFPPSKALDFLVVSTILGSAVTLIRAIKLSWKAQTSIVFVALAISFYLLLNPVLQHQGQATSLSWSIISALVTCMVVSAQSGTASNKHSHASAASLAIVAAATAPVVSIGGSLLIGQLLGAFAASVAGLILVEKFALKRSSKTALLLASFILAGLLAQAHVLADLPLWTMLVAYLALFINVITNLLITEDSGVAGTIKALIPQAIISGVITGFALWAIWPESSLY